MGGVTYSHVARGYLLDSHTFLWAVKNPKRLGQNARKIIESPKNLIYLSAISAYEITQKQRLGKLDASYTSISQRLSETAEQLGAIKLPVSFAEAEYAGRLAWEHRDPFDRFLAAQAVCNNLVLISNDAQLSSLVQIETIW